MRTMWLIIGEEGGGEERLAIMSLRSEICWRRGRAVRGGVRCGWKGRGGESIEGGCRR